MDPSHQSCLSVQLLSPAPQLVHWWTDEVSLGTGYLLSWIWSVGHLLLWLGASRLCRHKVYEIIEQKTLMVCDGTKTLSSKQQQHQKFSQKVLIFKNLFSVCRTRIIKKSVHLLPYKQSLLLPTPFLHTSMEKVKGTSASGVYYIGNTSLCTTAILILVDGLLHSEIHSVLFLHSGQFGGLLDMCIKILLMRKVFFSKEKKSLLN